MCAPGGPARENARPPGNGPRWPGNAAIAAAREHSAVCAARAPRSPPPPEAQLAPDRAARRAPGSVPHHPRAARKAPPAPQPGWPREGRPASLARGVCTPRGVSIPGRDRLETAAPSHAEKATIKRGINPARKGW